MNLFFQKFDFDMLINLDLAIHYYNELCNDRYLIIIIKGPRTTEP